MVALHDIPAGETDARAYWKQSFVGCEAQLNEGQVTMNRVEVLNVAFVEGFRVLERTKS